MFSYIKGELVSVSNDSIVIENNGIGFHIFIPASILSALPPVGSDIKIHTYFLVKEDAMQLYGFLAKDDLNVFQLLLTVSGIGPKGALAILSTITPDNLRFAVLAGDAKTISKAPGIGNKTAQRLIIELKDKLSIEDVFQPEEEGITLPKNDDKRNEAVQALVALGYYQSESFKAVNKVYSEDLSVEEILKLALKNML